MNFDADDVLVQNAVKLVTAISILNEVFEQDFLSEEERMVNSNDSYLGNILSMHDFLVSEDMEHQDQFESSIDDDDDNNSDQTTTTASEQVDENVMEPVENELAVLPKEETAALPKEETAALPKEEIAALPKEEIVALPKEEKVALEEEEDDEYDM